MKNLIAGNWKLNPTNQKEAKALFESIKKKTKNIKNTEIVICPPFVDLMSADESVKGTNLKLGAQNVFWEEEGPYTGEISPLMLKGLCKYVIVGHSERRIYLGETDKMIAKKAAACVRHELTPILCVGDSLQDFAEGFSKVTILSQLQAGVNLLTADEVRKIVIAYEPVWAIGTGKSCTPHKAAEVVRDIKHTIGEMFGKEASDKIRVLYGGSVKAKNSNDYFEFPEVDGLLVGGASVHHHEFSKIIMGAEKIK